MKKLNIRLFSKAIVQNSWDIKFSYTYIMYIQYLERNVTSQNKKPHNVVKLFVFMFQTLIWHHGYVWKKDCIVDGSILVALWGEEYIFFKNGITRMRHEKRIIYEKNIRWANPHFSPAFYTRNVKKINYDFVNGKNKWIKQKRYIFISEGCYSLNSGTCGPLSSLKYSTGISP